MCKPKSSGVSLRGVLLAIGVLVCLPVAGAVASVFGSLLVAALVTVYGAIAVSGVLLWRTLRAPQTRERIYKPARVAARQAPRELPATGRAIGAPVIVVRPDMVFRTDGRREVR